MNADVRKRWIWLGLVALLALGAAFRLSSLDRRPYLGDEIFSLRKASAGGRFSGSADSRYGSTAGQLAALAAAPRGAGVVEVVSALRTDDPKHGFVYFALLNLWTGLFGSSMVAVRALGALLALALVPLAFALVRALGGSVASAFLASAWMAVCPIEVELARLARPYGLLGVEGAAATLLLVRAVGGSRRAWVGYALVGALGLHTHLFFGFTLVAHGITMLLWPEGRKAWRWFAIAAAAIALSFAPIASGSLRGTKGGMDWADTAMTPAQILRVAVANFAEVFWPSPSGVEISDASLARGVATLAVVLLLLLWRQDRRTLFLVLPALLLPLAILAGHDLVNHQKTSALPRYVRSIYPMLIVGFALGAVRADSRKWATAAAFVVVFLALRSSRNLLREERRTAHHTGESIRAAAAAEWVVLDANLDFGTAVSLAMALPAEQRVAWVPSPAGTVFPAQGTMRGLRLLAPGRDWLKKNGYTLSPAVVAGVVPIERRPAPAVGPTGVSD